MSSCSACNNRYLHKCSTPFKYKHLAHVWCDDYVNFKFGKCKMECAIYDKPICCFECKEQILCEYKQKCNKEDNFADNKYTNCNNYIKAKDV